MQFRFDTFVLDTAQFALFDCGRKVAVEPKAFKLLEYLIENHDRVVSRSELLDKVFGRRVVTDNALTVRIREVRMAVGDSAKEQKIISTVQGGGYRFVAKVNTVSHAAANLNVAVQEENAVAPDLPDLSTDGPTVAILPFEVIGDDERDAIVARGLVHDVTTRVARSRTMFVTARGTAFQFESGAHDVREIGVSLGVRYVVQGAVQISGNRMRVSIGLASTESGREVDSWQYNKSLGDVLVIQDELADLIVGSIETEIQKQEIQRSTLIPSSNLDAWSAYHRGLSHMYRFRMKECDHAETFFRRAIGLEPNVPRPYAGLSFVHYERAYLNLDDQREKSLRRAFDYAHEAIAIDPMDPMGHWANSRAQFLRGDLDAARNSIIESTDLNPSYATAQYFLGWISMQLGDHKFAVNRIDFSRRLSPYDPLIYGMLGVSSLSLALLGCHDEALERALKALEHPDMHYQAHAMVVVISAIVGDLQLADQSMRRVLAVKPDYDLTEFFKVYAFQNDDDIRRITENWKEVRRRARR